MINMKIGSLRHTSTNLKDARIRHQRSAILALALAVVMMCGLAPDSTRADQQLPMITVDYQSGTITAIYETTFQIDGRTYSLTPDAVILDDRGKQLDAGALMADLEVKYHVKRDRNEKIDRMIVFLPR
jgi:hypothetical protein